MRSLFLVILLSVVVIGSVGIASAAALSDEKRIEKLQAAIDKLLDRIGVLEDKKADLYDRINNIDNRIDKLQEKANKKQSLLYAINGTELIYIESLDLIYIESAAGSEVPGCEETPEGCFIPSIATVDVGGKVIFSNTDSAAHTVTSGSPADGPSSVFDSGLILVGDSFEWSPTKAGEVPYFCMVHPWKTGSITVVDQ